MLDLSVIILTKDEEIHIERCLKNVFKLEPKQVFVVDSCSTDKTKDIAKNCGATVIEQKWLGTQALQFNWALDNCSINSKWILRLDADEYLSEDTIEEVKNLLPTLKDDITSLSMERFCVWHGTQIKHGVKKIILKRFFKFKVGKSETKFMDEHIVTEYGKDILLEGCFFDDNLKNMSYWINKHIDYALREAIDLLNIEYNLFPKNSKYCIDNFYVKKNLKMKYIKMPLFVRAFCYFIYRYIFKLGFLDGVSGFTWNFFQGLWYRMLVDYYVFDIKKKSNFKKNEYDSKKILEYIKTIYNLKY